MPASRRTPKSPVISSRFRRERFSGKLPSPVRVGADTVVLKRNARGNLRARLSSVGGLLVGSGVAATHIFTKSLANTDVKRAITYSLAAAAAGAIGTGAIGHAVTSREVRNATNALKGALHTYCKSYSRENPFSDSLLDFLYRHKYVFVDKSGRLTGTNMPRVFGVGRMRISTADVLPLVLVKAREKSSKK